MFKVTNLPYSYNYLEPHIDSLTMELHYTKHYFIYTDNLNKNIKNTVFEKKNIQDILSTCIKYPSIRNNAGGYYNHTLFWDFLTKQNIVDNDLLIEMPIYKFIIKNFKSFDKFKNDFHDCAIAKFGSGWVWLCYDQKKENLIILSTSNQDNPLMTELGFDHHYPLLALDLWEHAYYIKYNNRRSDYIKSFWNIVNWSLVNKLYLKYIA